MPARAGTRLDCSFKWFYVHAEMWCECVRHPQGDPNAVTPGCQANLEKLRLETKQRAARKAADRGEPIRPRWFNPVPGAVAGEQQAFVYTGGYWCVVTLPVCVGLPEGNSACAEA